MRYTHFGIGHSPMLRRIIRDCLGSESVAQPDGVCNNSNEEADCELEEVGDDNGHEECADEEEDDVESPEESDDEFSDEELDEGSGNENENEGYEDEDEFHDLSF